MSSKDVARLVEKLAAPAFSGMNSFDTVQELAALGAAAVPALVEALKNRGEEDNALGTFVSIALGEIADARANPALTAALAGNSSWEVRRRAAWALGKIGSPESVPALVRAIEHDANPDVRGFSAEALGAIGATDAIETLILVTEDLEITDNYSPVCYAAIGALGKIGGARAMDALIEILHHGVGSPMPDQSTALQCAFMQAPPLTHDDGARMVASTAMAVQGGEKASHALGAFRNSDPPPHQLVLQAVEKALADLAGDASP